MGNRVKRPPTYRAKKIEKELEQAYFQMVAAYQDLPNNANLVLVGRLQGELQNKQAEIENLKRRLDRSSFWGAMRLQIRSWRARLDPVPYQDGYKFQYDDDIDRGDDG